VKALAALILAAALAAPAEAAEARRPFDGLQGCWTIAGQVRGKPTAPHAKGRWVLDGKYFLLQLIAGPGEKPYQAAVFFGRTDDGRVIVHWLDIFGGEYSQVHGRGTETPDKVVTDFPYADGPTRNEVTLHPGGWRMLVTETPTGQATRVFSDYDARPAACSSKDRFPF
jgi:hypothetical protein